MGGDDLIPHAGAVASPTTGSATRRPAAVHGCSNAGSTRPLPFQDHPDMHQLVQVWAPAPVTSKRIRRAMYATCHAEGQLRLRLAIERWDTDDPSSAPR